VLLCLFITAVWSVDNFDWARPACLQGSGCQCYDDLLQQPVSLVDECNCISSCLGDQPNGQPSPIYAACAPNVNDVSTISVFLGTTCLDATQAAIPDNNNVDNVDDCSPAAFAQMGQCIDCQACIYGAAPNDPNCSGFCPQNCAQEMQTMRTCYELSLADPQNDGEGADPQNNGEETDPENGDVPPQCVLDSCTCFRDGWETSLREDPVAACDCYTSCGSAVEAACDDSVSALFADLQSETCSRVNGNNNQNASGPPSCLVESACTCFNEVRGRAPEEVCSCLSSCSSIIDQSCGNDASAMQTISTYIAGGCVPPEEETSTATVTFEGDYSTIVGSRRDEFLRECTIACDPVECVDVRAGSIIVTLSGEQSEVANAVQAVADNGNLPVPNFSALSYRSHTMETQPTRPVIVDPQRNRDPNSNSSIHFLLSGLLIVSIVFHL